MNVPTAIVDAFAEAPFAGNPAAVCLLDEPAAAGWMQRVAAEMNLSETAFVSLGEEPDGPEYDLRWFTPVAEVELCGHATLASAHLLWETGRAPREGPIRFATRCSGVLTCRLVDSGAIAMDFPADPPAPSLPPSELVRALGVSAVAIARGRYDWLIELKREAEVLAARPNFTALAAFETRGICITARAERRGFDFVSRFFAPRLRIDEDPVTGSAHCVLGPYWAERLRRATLQGFQASVRGGSVGVVVRGDRVELSGRAVTMLEGRFRAP